MKTYIILLGALILLKGLIIPVLMYRFDIDKIRTRYWGKNRTYIKGIMWYNGVISLVGFALFVAGFIMT